MGRCYLIRVSQSRWDVRTWVQVVSLEVSSGSRNKRENFLLLVAEQLPVVWGKASGKASAASGTNTAQPEEAAIGNTRLWSGKVFPRPVQPGHISCIADGHQLLTYLLSEVRVLPTAWSGWAGVKPHPTALEGPACASLSDLMT